MNRWTVGFAALVVAALTAAAPPAKAGTSVGVQIQIGDRYRGGEVQFRSEPDVVVVPSTRVYYVRDYNYDVYRYGSYWYFIDDGYWYRARTWRGPFVHVGYNSVPRSIRVVPVKYRRHWKNGPPSHAVAHGYYKDKDRHGYKDKGHYKGSHKGSHGRGNSKDNDRDNDRGNDRGNGKGNHRH